MGSFQKSSLRLADTQLLSTPLNDSHPSAIARAQRVEAVGILKDEDDRDIFAWLKLARSLERNLQPRSNDARLTHDQVGAIAALRHCESNDISVWLRLARTSSASRSPFSASPQVCSRTPDQGLAVPFVLSDASIPDPCDHLFDQPSTEQVITQDSLIRPFPTSTVPTPQADSKYCCTLCGYFRPFKNQSDWKKHEKEHDTTYVCMFRGPREATPQGAQCAFCGISNPHNDHFLEHNAQACLQGPSATFSSKRRHNMVNHLGRIHSIHPKSRGKAIAVKWKYTVEKQAWSCGFCGTVFVTFSDRLNHIAAQHFERGQTIIEWNATKVIQGLLQQPGMVKAWKEKLASLPAWEIPDIIWKRNAIIDLQHDLKVGPNDKRSAADLAEATYIACQLNWGMETQASMALAEVISNETFVASSCSAHQSQAPLLSAPEVGSNHYESLSSVQEFNEASHIGPAMHATPLESNGYSSTPMDDLNNSNNIGLPLSPFCSLQTQSVMNHRVDDNNGHGDDGNAKEESEVWSGAPGLIYETDFDTVFKIDEGRA